MHLLAISPLIWMALYWQQLPLSTADLSPGIGIIPSIYYIISNLKKEMKKATKLKLHSPVGGEPMVYDWPLSGGKNVYDGALEIAETIRYVRKEFPNVQAAMDKNILKNFDSKSYADMKFLCDNFNRAIKAMHKLGSSKWNHRWNQQASRSLLRHIIQQVYNRIVKDPKSLNRYKAFSSEVYGETSYELVAQMIDRMEISENDVFIDLGSGIGQVVLQMAASTKCQMCYGIEKTEVPSTYAKGMDRYFRKLMKWYGKAHGKYEIIKGDFTSEDLRERISSASIVFVNNLAFKPDLELALKERFTSLKAGARIISSRSFCPLNFRITDRNLTDIGAITHVSKLPEGKVSWTSKLVTYYLHTIDRTKLESYLAQVKSSREKDNENTPPTHRIREKHLANGKANREVKPAVATDTSSNDSPSNSNSKENNEADTEESDEITNAEMTVGSTMRHVWSDLCSGRGKSSKKNSDDENIPPTPHGKVKHSGELSRMSALQVSGNVEMNLRGNDKVARWWAGAVPSEDHVGLDENNRFVNLGLGYTLEYLRLAFGASVVITTSGNPSPKTGMFLTELERVIHNSMVVNRDERELKDIMQWSRDNGYTEFVVVSQQNEEPAYMLICHLAVNRTSFFKLNDVDEVVSNGSMAIQILFLWEGIMGPRPVMKRKASEMDGEEGDDLQPTGPTMEEYHGAMTRANKNPNKFNRRLALSRAKKLKSKLKRRERKRKQDEAEALGEDAPPRQVPHTLETLREEDESIATAAEPAEDIELDDFMEYFKKEYVPKVLITSSENPTKKTRLFMKELERIIPNSTVHHRRQAKIKKIVDDASQREGYTDIVVINEHMKKPSSMLISHLPEGPTSFFKLSGVKLTKDIHRDWKEMTSHRPEVLWTNFNTRLGISVGRMLAALFHYDPQFKGRRVVTFHNQRDYIFFRHHRYEFKKDGKKAALRELGPRFTMKLVSMQKGTFDSKTGEYEWIASNKRHELESSRRRFQL